ncbi:two-component system regulatory protein YycI [Cohnella suwonensis]|uniref:Two-component system regulatory protein YycI n=1 Tax=Cohnella suwonensis TaxID=696072 RepID=A0ABW0LQX3_9BACL
MDWRRAKSVLIVSFLALNIVLGYQLWMEWRERLNTAVDWTSLPPETLQVMREKNIQVDDNARIPTDTPNMRQLTYTFEARSGEGIGERMPISPAPETMVIFSEEDLALALSGIIPDLADYHYDQQGSKEGVYFVFNRMEGLWPMFDIRLKLYYSEQKIKGFTQDLVTVKPANGTKEQQVLSATKALAKVIEQNLPAGSVIKEIRLGYHGEIFDDAEAQVTEPTWRVLLENSDEVYYVNAISAEVTTEQGDAAAGRT